MAKLIFLCLVAVMACDAGFISRHSIYPDFPHLSGIYHGHGATSYQNVVIQNHGSVPIPNDLQVDDGNHPAHYADEFTLPTGGAYDIDESHHIGQIDPHSHYDLEQYGNHDYNLDYEYH